MFIPTTAPPGYDRPASSMIADCPVVETPKVTMSPKS